MTTEAEHERIAHILQQMGADEAQARGMAAQLLKRAGQMAEERKTDRLTALEYLLKAAIAGREGRVYEGPLPGIGTTMRGNEGK